VQLVSNERLAERPRGMRAVAGWGLGTALLLAIVQSCALDVLTLRSGSMIPTLFVGDRALVDKTAYGLVLPFTEWWRSDPVRLGQGELPARGSIVVFRADDGSDRLYVKRVIGLPGDAVSVRRDSVAVNGRALPRQAPSPAEWRALANRFGRAGMPPPVGAVWESIGAVRYTILPGADPAAGAPEELDCVVPSASLFVLGDNRRNSVDSRTWGPIAAGRVVGQARPV